MKQGQEVTETIITPDDFGLPRFPVTAVQGGVPEHNARLLQQLLNNELPQDHPIHCFVIMNAAALLLIAGKALSLIEGVKMARQSLSSGSALKALNRFRDLCRE